MARTITGTLVKRGKKGIFYVRFQVDGKPHMKCLHTAKVREAEACKQALIIRYQLEQKKREVQNLQQGAAAVVDAAAATATSVAQGLESQLLLPVSTDAGGATEACDVPAADLVSAAVKDAEGLPRKAQKHLVQAQSLRRMADQARQEVNALEVQRDLLTNELDAIDLGIPLAKAWTRYTAKQTRPDTGEATLRVYALQWGFFLRFLAEHYPKAVNMRDVTADMAEAYATHLTASGRTNNTRNKHMAVCRLVFKILAGPARVKVNPFADITPLKMKQESRRELSFDKVTAICDAAQGELKLLFFVGVYTGARLGDCCTLTWDNVDLMRRRLTFIPRKTASRGQGGLIIPMHPCLYNMLAAIPEAARQGYVLPGIAADYLTSADRVTNRIQALLTACGVQTHQPGTGRVRTKDPATGKVVSSGKRAVLRYGFHSLRHTAVSLMMEAGVPTAAVQCLVGHNSRAITQRYTHIGEAALSAAIGHLPSITGETGSGPIPVLAAPLVAAVPPSVATAIELLEGMTDQDWRQRRDDALAVLRAMIAPSLAALPAVTGSG